MTEPIELLKGQEMLPAEFPEPVMTCNLIIQREIKDAFTHFEFWMNDSSRRMEFKPGDKSDAARAVQFESLMHLQAYIGAAAIVDLLRTIQGMAPGLADDIARQFDWTHESGESGELLWQWAIEYGLDPEELVEESKAQIAKRDAK